MLISFLLTGCREELFYQLGLRQFGDFNRLKLEPPPPLRALVKLAVDAEEGTKHSRLSKAEIVDVRRSLRLQNHVELNRSSTDNYDIVVYCGDAHGEARYAFGILLSTSLP